VQDLLDEHCAGKYDYRRKNWTVDNIMNRYEEYVADKYDFGK
ncbi:hypothetical protein, partial [Listeria monocytogenes]